MQEPVHHYGYVVEHLLRTIERMLDSLQAGPFFLIEHVPVEDVTSGGAPAVFDHSSAFVQCGGSMIELMELHRCEPEAVRAGFASTPPRLHHLAWVVPALEPGIEQLQQAGFPAWLRAGLGEIRFGYQDATALFGHHVELHQDGPEFRAFFANIAAAAASWDGSDPIRSPFA